MQEGALSLMQMGQSWPDMFRVVHGEGHPVVWACDPMHANTYTAVSGRKTRDFDHISAEIAGFDQRGERGGGVEGHDLRVGTASRRIAGRCKFR